MRLLTPSKITAWLDCAHYLTLQHQLEDGILQLDRQPFGSLAQLLVDKGREHEHDCLALYRAQDRQVFEVPAREASESFESWVRRVGRPFDDAHDVIYQMPFLHDGTRGIADFLIRMDDPQSDRWWYEPVDAKLARTEAKPGHVLQLCFYADAIEAATGDAPLNLHLWLGSGRVETIRLSEVHPYWRRLRRQLTSLLQVDSAAATRPEPCRHCEFCEFAGICNDHWRAIDSLVYVSDIRSADRVALEAAGVEELLQLARNDHAVEGIRPERLQRLSRQAALQVEARDTDAPTPPFRLIDASEDAAVVQGFAAMPEPDEGDVFLDYEGHPFWRADSGLFFLFGLLTKHASGSWVYEARWAHDRTEEGRETAALINDLSRRRIAYPGMHVYHYNHTERSALERLAADHGTGESAVAELVGTGLFIDLLSVTKHALQAGVEGYGLKHIERLTGYQRGHDIDQGAGAVVEYEKYTHDGDPATLHRIAAYNEDDVRATRSLREWLVAQRPPEMDWRPAFFEMDESTRPDLDEQAARLHAFDPGTAEHLLGDLLGYWLREWRADTAPKLAKASQDTTMLLDDPDVLAGLELIERQERTGPTGRPKVPVIELRFPEQSIGPKLHPRTGGQTPGVIYGADEGSIGFATVAALDPDTRTVRLTWNERSQELAVTPTVVVLNDWVNPHPKPDALSHHAASMLDPTTTGLPNPATMALLRCDAPTIVPGHEPPDGLFADDLDHILEWAQHLDHSYLAIQGPPGTGKTYTGAHIVHRLVRDGKRVGITAMSHHAIDNLLREIVTVFERAGDALDLHAVRRGHEPETGPLTGVTYAAGNPKCAKPEYNLVAGTTWLFAGRDLRRAPVDVLIIDEAGQLALADALAAAASAHNIVLLGDPLQLPQVAKAVHPSGAGKSVLEHALGDDTTLPPTRGVFLTETRRMHPDVCRVISDHIYEGRLTSHPSCARQATSRGTGLRWLEAHHAGRSTESPEEAQLVFEAVAGLIGGSWTDANGDRHTLRPRDFMVVAPYNDQVALIRALLDSNQTTHGVPVGTVDKFQGQQAPIVFFTMTTSTAQDMPRGPEFLFSRNRLNVAISRARCLAHIVCTDDLLNSRARDVDEMKLIATLCAFVDACT